MTATPPEESATRRAARGYVRRLRGFYIHSIVYAATMLVVIGVNVAVTVGTDNTDEWWAWWFVWPLVGWGIGLAIHGIAVRMSRSDRLGSSWEERKIDSLLDER